MSSAYSASDFFRRFSVVTRPLSACADFSGSVRPLYNPRLKFARDIKFQAIRSELFSSAIEA